MITQATNTAKSRRLIIDVTTHSFSCRVEFPFADAVLSIVENGHLLITYINFP